MRRRRNFDEEEDEMWEDAPLAAPQISRGELSGSILAGLLFVYGFSQEDLPVCFLAASFLLWQLRVFTGLLKPAAALFARNLLQGLCLSLFLGAIVLMLW